MERDHNIRVKRQIHIFVTTCIYDKQSWIQIHNNFFSNITLSCKTCSLHLQDLELSEIIVHEDTKWFQRSTQTQKKNCGIRFISGEYFLRDCISFVVWFFRWRFTRNTTDPLALPASGQVRERGDGSEPCQRPVRRTTCFISRFGGQKWYMACGLSSRLLVIDSLYGCAPDAFKRSGSF